jgi:recombination protein RecA
VAFQRKAEEPKAPEVKRVAPTTTAEKFKTLFAISKDLDKKHSTTNSIIRLGTKSLVPIPSFPTGLPTFDIEVMQTGGVPKGRIVEIFGPESAGKTSMTLHIVAEAQKAGGLAAFVDAEHALDPIYASKLGVDVDNLLLSQPDSGEQALQIAEALVDSMCVDLIVVDSVAALVPEAELAGEIGDAHVGLQARLMSQALRILTGKASKNKVTIIFINQIREKIGVMFGSPETTTGGRALKFYSSIRIDVRRREAITDGSKENIVGHKLELKAVKNKVGTPFRITPWSCTTRIPGSLLASTRSATRSSSQTGKVSSRSQEAGTTWTWATKEELRGSPTVCLT